MRTFGWKRKKMRGWLARLALASGLPVLLQLRGVLYKMSW